MRQYIYIQPLLFYCLLFAGVAVAQSTQPFFHNYTPENGLPSSETYCALQDREGYMWFGTDNGVARFDGYTFRNYGIEEGLTDVVVFNIVSDDRGDIWVSTYTGRVFHYINDRFVEYEHNQVLINRKSRHIAINLLKVETDSTLIFKADHRQIFAIDNSGTLTNLNVEGLEGFNIHMVADYKTNGEFASIDSGFEQSSEWRKSDMSITNLIWKDGKWKNIGQVSIPKYSQKKISEALFFTPLKFAYSDRQDMLLIISDKIYYSRGKDLFVKDYKHSYFNQILPHNERGFWVGMGRGKGLLHLYLSDEADEQQSLQSDTLLYGNSVSNIYYDNRGGLWVTSLDQGIYYSSNPTLNTYNQRNGKRLSTPISLQMINSHTYYAGYDDRRLGYHDTRNYEYHNFTLPFEQARSISSMAYSPKAKRMYSSVGSFKHNDNFDVLRRESPIDYRREPIMESLLYQPYVLPDLVTGDAFNKKKLVDMLSGTVETAILRDGTNYLKGVQSYGITSDGREFIGTLEGLYELIDENTTVKDNLGFPELDTRIISINQLINGGTLFGTRGEGLVYVSKNGNNVINVQDGLASDIVRSIHQTRNGDIWIATLSGLSKLRLSPSGEIEEIRSFYREHGLASNEIMYIDSYNDDVWLATGNGIVQFREPPVRTTYSPPIIRWIKVDGVQRNLIDKLDITPGQHDLKIAFSALYFQMLGNINYRYRLSQEAPWQYTDNRIIEYSNLSAGEYQFEVQSQNQDRYWSSSSLLSFTIPALWYRTWWARLLLLLAITTAIAGIFALRERRQRREKALTEQIDELERAAVQAQMNPHFVFNSLNSIQYFILQSNTREAVYYLSRFASLIRQTLRASVSGVHTLKEEIGMLEIYLSLEKLRFKNSFDYQISCDPALPVDLIKVSPMLVQPFVENAILHGMADVEAGGMINIDFQGSHQEITVKVEDNGCGFDPDATSSPDSMGMKITRKRLYKYDRSASKQTPTDQENRLRIQPRLNQYGQQEGTIVVLKITPL